MEYYSYLGTSEQSDRDHDDIMVDYMWRDLQRQLSTLSVENEGRRSQHHMEVGGHT